jgi:hypothetical protein
MSIYIGLIGSLTVSTVRAFAATSKTATAAATLSMVSWGYWYEGNKSIPYFHLACPYSGYRK